jgi:hypothetical protein
MTAKKSAPAKSATPRKKAAAKKVAPRREPIVSAQQLMDEKGRGYDPKLTPKSPLPEEYDPSTWHRGDMVSITLPLNDKGATYEQLLVAADHPDRNFDECWLVVADENNWDSIGGFRTEAYLREKNARRIFSQHDRVKQNEPTAKPEPLPVPPRSTLLFEAEGLITGDRNASYGSPTENFQNTADLWTTQFKHLLKDGARFTAAHIAQGMMQLKLARMVAQPKRDNYLDLAGYAACGWECEEETGSGDPR